MHTLKCHRDIVPSVAYSIAFSRDGTRVVSGSNSNHVKIWDAETGAEVSSHPCTGIGLSFQGRETCGVRCWACSEFGAVCRCAR